MWISELKLYSIQSYEIAQIKLSRSINLLVGHNNSGKSTIIKSIYKLQGYSRLNNDSIRKGEYYAEIRARIKNSKNWYFAEPTKDGGLELPVSDDHFVMIRLGEHNLPSFRYQADLEKYAPFPASNSFRIDDDQGNSLPYHTFQSFSSEEPDNLIYPFLARRKTDHFEERPDIKSSNQISDTLRNLTSRIQQLTNSSHPEHGNYEKACKDILGFGVGLIPSHIGSGIGIYATKYDHIPIESMGDGVANIVGLLALLFTDIDKVFLIEELENDIHPEALKKLLELIIEKSNSNQFVVSTHSNIVLKYLGSANGAKVFKTRSEIKDHIPTSSITEVENTPEAKREVLLELGYELHDNGLWEGYLILEESSAESIINELLIPWFVPTLSGRIRTVSTSGISRVKSTFKDFQRLFLFTHLEPVYKNRAWVLVDGGMEGENTIAQLKSDFEGSGWNKDCFGLLSQTDIEFYFPTRFQEKANQILSLKGKQHAQAKAILKLELLNEVKVWAQKEPQSAKDEFEKSASEIIIFLKRIEKQISKR
jgi:predicted ATP-dependent endonuclease of OLD family